MTKAHVVPSGPLSWPLKRQYLLSVAVVAAALIVRALLTPLLQDRGPFLPLYAALLMLVVLVRPGPFLLGGALGTLGSWYFFILPAGPPGSGQPVSGWMIVLFALAIAAAGLTARLAGRLQDAARVGWAQAEAQALAQSDALRVTLASIGDAVVTTDIRGRVTFLNDAAQHLTGWSHDRALGLPLPDVFRIVNEHTREPVENPVQKVLRSVLQSGRAADLADHALLIRRDGGELPIDDSAAPIRDGSGRITGVVLVFSDITARRESERTTQRSVRELSELFEHACIGLQWVSPQGRILRANQAQLALLGWPPEAYVGRLLVEFDAGGHVAELLAALDRGETPPERCIRMRHRDGTARDVQVNCSAFVQDDRYVHARFFMLDVTERNRAEQALRESEQRLRFMADANLIGVGFSDRHGTLSCVNDEMLRMMGCTRQQHEARALNWIERLAPEYAQAHTLWAERLRVHGSLTGYENAFVQPGGQRIPFVGAAALLEPGSDMQVSIALDLSELKQAEQARAQLLGQLRDADRRKDEFLATLAHELRNPLAPVIHGVEILKRSDADALASQAARDTIERQIRHMVRLIDDLMDVSRITRDKLELRRTHVDLRSLLDQAVETCSPDLAASGQQLVISMPGEPVHLLADPARLIQVFSNLLGNAGHYSHPGGLIGLTVQWQGEQVVVSVKDSGMGITREMLPRIFDLFAQGAQAPSGAGRGLGIGLTLAKRLVELHGGELQAQSDGPGQGSEFIVRLPSAPEQPVMVGSEPVPLAGRYRVLIVDDNVDAATTLAMLLGLAGHDTRVAHDGLEALQAAADYRPHVALLDIGLPTLTGHELARRLRQQPWGRQLVLVAITGWGQEADRLASRSSGFDAHLVKPVDHATLLSVLTGLLGGEGRAGARPPD